MKPLSFLTFFVVFILKTMGQGISIMEPNLKWNIGTHFKFEGPIAPYDFWSTTFLHIEGDTLMNDKLYKKLLSCDDTLCAKEKLKSYVREEAKQIFLANKEQELLQFDFGLQKGETLIVDFLNESSRQKHLYIRVDSVKSLIFNNQKERIAQYVTIFDYYNNEPGSYSMPDVFVEGIGSLKFGIEYPETLFIAAEHTTSPTLLCFHSGDDLIYSNPEINKCLLNTGIPQLPRQPELIQVRVNNGTLEIQSTKAKTGKISIFDIQGRRILFQKVNESFTQFCMPESGIFLYHFETEKGETQSGKVFVN